MKLSKTTAWLVSFILSAIICLALLYTLREVDITSGQEPQKISWEFGALLVFMTIGFYGVFKKDCKT